MTREDINDIINAICPNDEDYEKPCISPKYLRQELEQLALDQRQWSKEPTTKNDLGVDAVNREAVLDLIADYDLSMGQVVKGIHALPSVTPQEPFDNRPCVSSGVCEHDKQKVLDKIKAEITNCLKALDEIEKSGLNIYLPNEISGRRLTYQQCLKFIDKYKTESEDKE